MPRELRGERYLLRPQSEWLAKAILEHLPTLDYRETGAWFRELIRRNKSEIIPDQDVSLLACNDRFFLLTCLLGRRDLRHPWLFERCREVEADPDGYLDLWARGHGKSSIITFAGNIQDILCDPEVKIAIFSVTKPIAAAFLGQIKEEFEQNDLLKRYFPDVLYQNPRTLGPDGKPAKWGLARGITVKRKGNPKEATVEAHGLIDGQPTSRHYDKLCFDDVVTQDYLSDEQIKKTTLRFEMADNLGTHLGVRKQVAGTYYHFNDTYVQMRDRKSLKPRIYPATDNGRINGRPVLLSPEDWDKKKRDQRSTIAAQMLLDPIATTAATFNTECFTSYAVLPAVMNVYILVDPSKGKGARSDRTAIAVIGIDPGGSKYLIDGVCHRMKLSERWGWIKHVKQKWENHPGVQMVKVGYEQYGLTDDINTMTDMMMNRENYVFEIIELKTPDSGAHSKIDRINRLEPDIRDGRFLLPCVLYHPDFKGKYGTYWSVWTQELAEKEAAEGKKATHAAGEILYRPAIGLMRSQTVAAKHRVVSMLVRRDENEEIYDVTRRFIDEARLHPFAPHDDMIDATSRIYDIEPFPPKVYEAQSTEPLGLEQGDLFTETGEDYDIMEDPSAVSVGGF